MHKFYINPEKNTPVHANGITGLCGFISWKRLAEELRVSGEVKAAESIELMEIDERGITYSVKDREQRENG